MPKITIPANGWRPRPYQLKAWGAFERGIKRQLLVWHRRAGKDELALHQACVAAHLRPANYWHCLPTYEQAKKAIWEAVNPHSGKKRIDEAFPPILRKRTDNSSMTIEFKTGSVWRIVGSDNPDSLVGAPPAGVVFSEWALCNPSAWGLLQPILLENNGWASFITTPRGRNHVRSMLEMARKNPNWFAEVLTVDDTHQVSPDQIEEARTEYTSLYGKEAADALIQQEYWCSFEAAILGAYYGKELSVAEQAGRICVVGHDETCPVHTAWDLGVDDAMAIWWFQCVAGQVRVLDYHEGHGYGISHYADLVKRTASERGYTRGTDYVPHDARQREMTSSGHDGRAKQRLEVMIECGLKPKVIAAHSLIDGISAARQILGRCWWDEEKTAEGLNALRSYQTEWDDDAKTFKKTPLHNWACVTAETLVLTDKGTQCISSLPKTGKVLTPCGLKDYYNPHMTRKDARLVEVVFMDGLRVKCTADHLFLTENGWRYAAELQPGSVIQSSLMPRSNTSRGSFFEAGRAARIGLAAENICTFWFGRKFLARCQRAVRYTTKTRTFLTTQLRIWNAWIRESILDCLGQSVEKFRVIFRGLERRLACALPIGTNLQQEGSGTGITPSVASHGLSGSASHARAPIAERSSIASLGKTGESKGSVRSHASSPTIASVRPLNERAHVWCLTVPDGHVWSLANGAVTHNSHGADAFRYLAMAYREIRAQPQPESGKMFSMDPTTLPPGARGVTLNEMWAQPQRRSGRI